MPGGFKSLKVIFHAARAGRLVAENTRMSSRRHAVAAGEQRFFATLVKIALKSEGGNPKNAPTKQEPNDHPRTEVEGEMYGHLKVTCENIVQQTYSDRCALLRPHIVVGPRDPSGRYSYWVQRAMLDGEML